MNDTTNAGPVLPEAPYFLSLYDAEIGDAYGRQCWNACAEHVAGPLRERVAALERSFDELAGAVGWTRDQATQDGRSPVNAARAAREG